MQRLLCVAVVGLVVTIAGCPAEEQPCSPKTEKEVARLADFVDVACDVDITDTELTNIDALQGLRSAKSVTLGNNIALTEIELGLSGLQSLASLNVFGNPNVTAVVFEGEVSNVSVSQNNVDVIDLTDIHGGLSIQNEPAATVELHASPVFQLNLFEVTSFASFEGIDGSALSALTIHNAPILTQAEVDAFVGGIDPPPAIVQVCGTVGGAACE